MRSVLAVVLMSCLPLMSMAQPLAKAEKKAYDDPALAAKTIDFQMQGEYVGEVQSEKGDKGSIGVQVIAKGDGKFQAVMFLGGLPGDGGQMKSRIALDGELDGEQVVFKNDRGILTIKGDTLTANDANGKVGWQIKKTERTSPTIGAKPPAGATVLFDGKKETFEKNWAKGARMTDDGLLMEGCNSLASFTDFELHIEFRLPFQPFASGQQRGNSGIYFQGRHEVQMLDSFGLLGKDNECGGIYTVQAPDVNMCLPPLAWQTYDADFTAARFDSEGKKTASARITIKHNGVVIHDNVEVPKSTTASPKKEGAEPGPIYLQNHGNPVRYRNIWIEPKQ